MLGGVACVGLFFIMIRMPHALRHVYPWVMLLLSCAVVVIVAMCCADAWSSDRIDLPDGFGQIFVNRLPNVANFTEAANHPNEDTSLIQILPDGSYFIGVFDGHGGSAVSELASHLFRLEVNRLADSEMSASLADRERTLGRIFANVHRRVTEIQTEKSRGKDPAAPRHLRIGSCALVLWVKGVEVIVGNLGDSRAYFFPYDPSSDPIPLNNMHNIALPVERAQMMARFPEIPEDKLIKCTHNNHNPVCYLLGKLQLTRALGDLHLKPYVRHEPELATFVLTEPGTLLLGSDGFWDDADMGNVADRCQAMEGQFANNDLGMVFEMLEVQVQDVMKRIVAELPGLDHSTLAYTSTGPRRRKLHDDMTLVGLRIDNVPLSQTEQ